VEEKAQKYAVALAPPAESVSFGRRIAIEIKDAEKAKMIEKVTT
jgi:5-formaminoimidazole-4-carboxamide-1-beta-D-ribofuranosyl 5'-monophosphate synthetase